MLRLSPFRLLPLLFAALAVAAVAQRRLTVGVADVCAPKSAGVLRTYTAAIQRGGHVALVLPQTTDTALLAAALDRVDLLFLTGGEDIEPARYGAAPSPALGTVNAARDTFEMALLDVAVRRRLPVFGTCRGLQLLNVYFGGTLFQDLPSERAGSEEHMRADSLYAPIHGLRIDPSSRLFTVLQTDSLGVNSTHHQAVRTLAPGFRAVAFAPDGVVEAIESTRLPIAAVQFHPERLALGDDTVFTRLFRRLAVLCGAE